MNRRFLKTLFIVLLVAFSAVAHAEQLRGVMIRDATIYLNPDATSAKLATIGLGREVAIMEQSGRWLHVLASITEEKDVTGWMQDKGVVHTNDPNGDKVMFGAGADAEAEATKRHGRRGAAQEAMRLYARMAEYFKNSPLAGEAAYRAADIRWQIEREDVMTRPSAKERDPIMRGRIDEDYMHDVMKKFPHTKWAALAAFNLIDNKLCGDWGGSVKCPEKESEIYEKYATEYPDSPKASEALYNAAWRHAALVDMYRSDNDAKKSEENRGRTVALAQKIASQYPQTDWAMRAQLLIFKLQQGIPVYGNPEE